MGSGFVGPCPRCGEVGECVIGTFYVGCACDRTKDSDIESVGWFTVGNDWLKSIWKVQLIVGQEIDRSVSLKLIAHIFSNREEAITERQHLIRECYYLCSILTNEFGKMKSVLGKKILSVEEFER